MGVWAPDRTIDNVYVAQGFEKEDISSISFYYERRVDQRRRFQKSSGNNTDFFVFSRSTVSVSIT